MLAQDYPGEVASVVVLRPGRADPALADVGRAPGRLTRAGQRADAGLAGTRNTGILALDTDLIAFCDDDDDWRPGKLSAQVDALRARPGAEFASCGDRGRVRRPGTRGWPGGTR